MGIGTPGMTGMGMGTPGIMGTGFAPLGGDLRSGLQAKMPDMDVAAFVKKEGMNT